MSAIYEQSPDGTVITLRDCRIDGEIRITVKDGKPMLKGIGSLPIISAIKVKK